VSLKSSAMIILETFAIERMINEDVIAEEKTKQGF
jgi:hypothetical protein